MRGLYASLLVSMLVACTEGQVIPSKSRTLDGDYNSVNADGSFDFGYANPDRGGSYHLARANGAGVVGGRFGARDLASGVVKETVYTAGPRGFRAKGPNVHRKMDLDQRPRGPIGSPDDPYFDPSEDPSYSFRVNTPTYSKNEDANSRGDVKGHYSFVDDVGERHDISYVAGRDTGFHVTSAHPDGPGSVPAGFYRTPLVRGETRERGRSSVKRELDGSYRFVSAGPDQRRTESSDSHGNVRGSYSYLDDKGVQRTVHYIAGPGIGYRIVKSSKDPFIPTYFPTLPSVYDPDFAFTGDNDISDRSDDVFKGPDGTSASGHVKPPPYSAGEDNKPKDIDLNDKNAHEYGPSTFKPSLPGKPRRPFRPLRPLRPFSPHPPYKPSVSAPSDSKTQENAHSKDNGYTYTPPKRFPSHKNFNKDDKLGDNVSSDGPEFGIGFDVNHSDPGATIIRNIGDEFLSVPPGVSVRAHVQSIDLFPFGAKRLSPGEAIDTVKA